VAMLGVPLYGGKFPSRAGLFVARKSLGGGRLAWRRCRNRGGTGLWIRVDRGKKRRSTGSVILFGFAWGRVDVRAR